MTTAAIIGIGTTVQINDGASPSSWFTLGEVTSITPPSDSIDQIDVTHMGSTGRTREFISGLSDPGDMSLEINWIPSNATDAYILAWKTAGTSRSTKITYPNGAIDTFDSFVLGYQKTLTPGEKLSATLSLKVAGAVTRT